LTRSIQKQLTRHHLTFGGLLVSVLILSAVSLSSIYSYLLFHSLAELFSIVIACCIFILTWNSRPFLTNNYLLFIGLSSLFIGLFDLLHMLAYKGMGVFPGNSPNLPTQLWIAGRYLQTAVMLLAPFLFRIRLSSRFTIVILSVISTSLILCIFVFDVFPICYVEGAGLTPFKIGSEYLLITALAVSVLLLIKIKDTFEPPVFHLLVGSSVLFAIAELAFTSYLGVYDTANLLGHLIRIVSFYLLYKAIVVTGIVSPFELIFRELRQSKQKIEQYNTGLELQVAERTKELTRSNLLLQREINERRQAEQHILRKISQLGALRAIDISIATSFDLNATLDVIVQQACIELKVEACSILLYNQNNNILSYGAGVGFRTATITGSNIPLGYGITGQAASQKILVEIPDLTTHQRFLRPDLVNNEKFVSYVGAPLIAKGKIKGVLEIFSRAKNTTDKAWYQFLETLADQAAIAIDNATLFHELESTNINLSRAYEATMEGWVKALDLRDKETENHALRVAEITVQLARIMGFEEKKLIHVRRGALLHDIGKIGIPDNILHKPGPLNKEEWNSMRQHPVHAYKMLSPIQYLHDALDIPYCHHERWDSTGYPRGLNKIEIPLAARIFTVVDVWDALCSDRPYRSAMPEADVRSYIRNQAGKQFDPEIASVFLDIPPHMLAGI
jgi:putative nucleotidyltransferase with HDIG domain